jgi:hypothetical protein
MSKLKDLTIFQEEYSETQYFFIGDKLKYWSYDTNLGDKYHEELFEQMGYELLSIDTFDDLPTSHQKQLLKNRLYLEEKEFDDE